MSNLYFIHLSGQEEGPSPRSFGISAFAFGTLKIYALNQFVTIRRNIEAKHSSFQHNFKRARLAHY
jgi:hypothetical protein